ncbi:MAG: nucleoside hydrolase, partial [Paenibacillaceae bacterium]|nr:nucleoside hydrolase [Paenibacillaceae bacterium]
MKPKKVIIDTDLGDDVDDAVAIALAVLSPEIEVAGITTVFKDTKARAEMVKDLLEFYQ